jgi:hypothetical protein
MATLLYVQQKFQKTHLLVSENCLNAVKEILNQQTTTGLLPHAELI